MKLSIRNTPFGGELEQAGQFQNVIFLHVIRR